MVRQVVAAAGGQIIGVMQGLVEPQKDSAFLVQLDGYRFAFGAISKADLSRMGAYVSMGEFSAGMDASGSVGGVALAGSVRTEHWSWQVHGFTVEITSSHAPRATIAKLVAASINVPVH